MASIIKKSNRIRAAISFVNEIDSASTKVYIGLSGTTAWGDEANPDSPVDTFDESESFWDELFGVAKITSDNTFLAIQRKNWTSGIGYNVFDVGHPNAYDLPFYALGSNNYVYECTGIPVNNIKHVNTANIINSGSGYSVSDVLSVTGGTSTITATLTVAAIGGSGEITDVTISNEGSYTVVPVDPVSVTGGSGTDATFELSWVADDTANEPTHTVGAQTTADGYEWTVIYDILTNLDMLTSNWLPVENVYATQIKLGANRVLIRGYLPDYATTGNKIASITYRKIGILIDPLKTDDSVLDIVYGDNTDFDPTYSEQDAGVVLMLDHRTSVARQASQTETVFVILEF